MGQALLIRGPDYAPLHAAMGTTFRKLKRYDEAVLEFRSGLDLCGLDFMIHMELVDTLLDKNDKAAARKELENMTAYTHDGPLDIVNAKLAALDKK